MRMRVRLARRLGPMLLRSLAGSWRYREADASGTRLPTRTRLEPSVYALWHSQLLPLMMGYGHAGLVALASHHGDGEIAAAIVEALGSRVVRGSSSAGGGEALDRMVELGREGWPLAITPDGPRGPAERSKPGVVRIAARSGLPIVPVAACPEKEWRMNSWDGFIVPKPFTVVHVEFAPRIEVPADAEGAQMSAWLERIDGELSAARERCRRRAVRGG